MVLVIFLRDAPPVLRPTLPLLPPNSWSSDNPKASSVARMCIKFRKKNAKSEYHVPVPHLLLHVACFQILTVKPSRTAVLVRVSKRMPVSNEECNFPTRISFSKARFLKHTPYDSFERFTSTPRYKPLETRCHANNLKLHILASLYNPHCKILRHAFLYLLRLSTFEQSSIAVVPTCFCNASTVSGFHSYELIRKC